jgi:hypothetical protein
MFHLVGDILFSSNPLYLPCSQGPTSFFIFLMVDQGFTEGAVLVIGRKTILFINSSEIATPISL